MMLLWGLVTPSAAPTIAGGMISRKVNSVDVRARFRRTRQIRAPRRRLPDADICDTTQACAARGPAQIIQGQVVQQR